eukprot:CAMPEP_0119401666 /NCGR_PEP_ID=MMETSP1334-20130426/142489_1 /TAXON_ID=127549 /ORGANISM="Calcidiscus leptoporus, Strain RCC1130" /LENGTH=152 /DNA_ID=CAMNT_0007425587 /DNA_START=793 /DNA_END=1247 /DNA_ORIENTATION=-
MDTGVSSDAVAEDEVPPHPTSLRVLYGSKYAFTSAFPLLFLVKTRATTALTATNIATTSQNPVVNARLEFWPSPLSSPALAASRFASRSASRFASRSASRFASRSDSRFASRAASRATSLIGGGGGFRAASRFASRSASRFASRSDSRFASR